MAAPNDTADEEAFDYGELVVLQHDDQAPLSLLAELLDARAHRRPYTTLRPDRGDPLPTDLDRLRGVIVLGGATTVHDAPADGWVAAEREWLAAALTREVAVLGIGLGHHLLAQALGGTVAPRTEPLAGLVPVHRTEAAEDDPVWAGWPDGSLVVLVADEQVTAAPDGAAVLATGTGGVTAFRTADGLGYGVAFHPEASADTLAGWARQPEQAGRFAGVDTDALVEEARRRERFLRAASLSLAGRWIDGVAGRDDPTPRRRRKKAA